MILCYHSDQENPTTYAQFFLRTLLRQESIPKTLKLKEYPNETKKKVIKIHKNFGANKAWGEFSVDDVNKHNSKMVGFEWWHIHKMDVYLQHSEVQYTHTMGQLIPSILYYELCHLHFWKAPSSIDNLSRLTWTVLAAQTLAIKLHFQGTCTQMQCR